MPPPPAGRGLPDDKPLLHVGPWQEYALSALLSRMRAHSMDEVMQAMASMAAGGVAPEGLEPPLSGAVSPVDSYVGSMSSARSERSAQSVNCDSSDQRARARAVPLPRAIARAARGARALPPRWPDRP